jgi:hypothetical protein
MSRKRGANVSEQPSIVEFGISSGPTDLVEGQLIARLTFE